MNLSNCKVAHKQNSILKCSVNKSGTLIRRHLQTINEFDRYFHES